MHSLRQVLSDAPRCSARQINAKACEDRRAPRDRRVSDRRSHVYPFESRDARLRFAAQAAGFGTYDLDCASGDSLWSPELRTMAGLPQNREPLSTEQAESLIHPQDRERFLEKLRASLQPQGDGEFEDEHRLLRPDGSFRWVKTKGRTFFVGEGENRRPLAATGIVMDVTVSRAAAQELAESREELAKLEESAIDAIITVDEDQRIVRFNPSAARIFHCPVDAAIGSPLGRFIPERFRAAHSQHVADFAEGGITARNMGLPGVFSGMRTEGEEFPIEASIAKVEVGGRRRMTVFLRDITERKEAEEALRRSMEDLELAVRVANIGIWHWDLRTDQVELSDRCRQLFGMTVVAHPDIKRVLTAIHPDDRERVASVLQLSIQNCEEYRLEKRFVWPDGSIHWLACIGREICDQDTGQPIGLRGISMDITEHKRQEEALVDRNEQLENRIRERTRELVRANEALERSNLELQQFAFIAAHDLQTPLRSISGFAQLLQKDFHGQLGSQAEMWLDQLIRSVHQMRDVIRDVLTYSRVESRGEAFRSIDFNQLVDDVLATLDAPIRETGARVFRDPLPTLEGDRTQLAQVLQNLIENGLKYHGSEPPRIHVSAQLQEQEWVFSVRDNGIGIAEKHLENIFEIFRRLHTQQEYPGTGIGLAVCRRVIHRHGGRIWAESQIGKGTTFFFTLPDRRSPPLFMSLGVPPLRS